MTLLASLCPRLSCLPPSVLRVPCCSLTKCCLSSSHGHRSSAATRGPSAADEGRCWSRGVRSRVALPPSSGKWATWSSLHFCTLSRRPGAAAPSSLQTPFSGQCSPRRARVCTFVQRSWLCVCAGVCLSRTTWAPVVLRTALWNDSVSPRVWVVAKLAGGDGARLGLPGTAGGGGPAQLGPGDPVPVTWLVLGSTGSSVCVEGQAVPPFPPSPASAECGPRVEAALVAQAAELDRFCSEASPGCRCFSGWSLVKFPFVCQVAKYRLWCKVDEPAEPLAVHERGRVCGSI